MPMGREPLELLCESSKVRKYETFESLEDSLISVPTALYHVGACQVMPLDLISKFSLYQSCRDLDSCVNNYLRSQGNVW